MDGSHVTCAICREVFKDPKFLVGCYHTFCRACIDEQARVLRTSQFRCPICRSITTLSKLGAVELEANFYIKEDVLEEARKLVNRKCTFHTDNDIDRVCIGCREPACSECTDNHEKHFKHKVLLLSQVEEAMRSQVVEIDEFLTINQQALQSVKTKTSALTRHLCQQRAILHAMVDQQFKMNDRALWQKCRAESKKLVKEITGLQEERKKSVRLHNLCKHSLQDPSNVSLVDTARKVRSHLNNGAGLPPMKGSTCTVNVPGLASNLTKEKVGNALSQFLGCPTEHPPPTGPQLTATKDIKLPLRFSRPKEEREILGVTPSHDAKQVIICFRGDPPHLKSSIATVQAEDGKVLNADHDVVSGKGVCIYNYNESDSVPLVVQLSYYGVFQVSKTMPSVCLLRNDFGTVSVHRLGVNEDKLVDTRFTSVHEANAESLLQYVDVVDPINFDVGPKGEYYVIVDRAEDTSKNSSRVLKKLKFEDDGKDGTSKKKKKKKAKKMKCFEDDENDGEESLAYSEYHSLGFIRQPPFGAVVKLFRHGETRPVDIYRPTKPSFLPSDVCFCHFGKQNVLLIADWQNDDVHVVKVKENQFHFQRLLAEGHGELVKPSCLNTDTSGWVWIGCSNGSLLCCTMED